MFSYSLLYPTALKLSQQYFSFNLFLRQVRPSWALCHNSGWCVVSPGTVLRGCCYYFLSPRCSCKRVNTFHVPIYRRRNSSTQMRQVSHWPWIQLLQKPWSPFCPEQFKDQSLFLISLWNTAFDLHKIRAVSTLCQSWISYFSLFSFGLGPSIHFLTDTSTFCESSVRVTEASLCTRAPAWVTFPLEGVDRVQSLYLPALYVGRHIAHGMAGPFPDLGFASTSLKHPSRFACSLLPICSHVRLAPTHTALSATRGGFLGLLLPSALSAAFSPPVLSCWCRQRPLLSRGHQHQLWPDSSTSQTSKGIWVTCESC